MLGVHPNTVRNWTDAGQLPCLRINERGDRRYRRGDVEAFLAAAHLAGDGSAPATVRSPQNGPVSRAVAARLQRAEELSKRAELLISLGSELGARLEPVTVLTRLVDRAAELFGAQHAAVYSRSDNSFLSALVTLNLSADYVHAVEHATSLPMTTKAFDGGQIVTATDYASDPRAGEMGTPLLAEGINTVTIAPLVSGSERLGVLALYHDDRHRWSADDLRLLELIAQQGASVMRTAQNYTQMATWAAQLQSIQQLGARLTGLRSVADIGQAICAELTQLITSQNIRVYRVHGDDCVPVAWRGEVGEYEGEEPDQLYVQVGEGVTGWVARYGLAQNVGNAATDERAKTIPGTAADLDESLLLAPMRFEDEVIGVIVLAKLGLNQFTADDLRLLEIYASIAAQAMANADVTERMAAQSEMLARQVNSQRELLRVTESLLGTLDTQGLLEQIADSLSALLQVDNICVDVRDEPAHMLRPIFARGVNAEQYMAATLADHLGVGGVAVRTGDAQLIQDELADPNVAHFESTGPQAGALIVAPLRSAERIQGLLTIERLGGTAHFSDEEFELVKLFAGHVSIALRNAATHRAVEIRAETDRLTGLWNHGALMEEIDRLVADSSRFSMLMVDLDFFKRYNDGFGHQAGNAMLQRIALELRSSGRDADMVFRFGGDEFALLLPGSTASGARTVAEKVQRAVAAIGEVDGVHLTCSIGMASYPRDGLDGAAIILAADRACYAGKRAGRDRVATAAEGLALAGDFRPTEPTPLEAEEPAYSAA